MSRKTASEITDPELDALYAERDRMAALLDVVLLELLGWQGDASLEVLCAEFAVPIPPTATKPATKNGCAPAEVRQESANAKRLAEPPRSAPDTNERPQEGT